MVYSLLERLQVQLRKFVVLAGYLGKTTMAVISEKCPEIKVTLVDLNEEDRRKE